MSFLDQDEVWVSKSGVHQLVGMDPDHRSNLIPFLRGNKVALFRMYDFPRVVALAEDLNVIEAAAEEWLEAKPLMRRLVELEQGRDIDARRATHERNVRHEAETGYQKVRLG